MKQLIAFILISSLLTPFFSKMMVYVDFKLHQDVIAETLCLNKDLPGAELCYGSCYLSTQLEKIDDKRQKQIPNYLKDKKQVVFVQDLMAEYLVLPQIISVARVFQPTGNAMFLSSNYLQKILQPPQFLY